MGSIWLTDLPDVLTAAGLRVTTYGGWETRSRSTGGYDAVLAIGIHHDAGNVNQSNQSAWDWAWKNSSDRPIGCIRLSRDGLICVGAAGATNTMGKGGPLTCSRGTVPLDKGNQFMIAIEAANNGVGEAWAAPMVDAYVRMCRALCDAYDLDPGRDIFTHNSYVEPSCPGRKIDPAGPTPGQPSLGGTSGCNIWHHDDFRELVINVNPPAPPEDEVTQEDIDKIADAVTKKVWAFMINDPSVNKMTRADALLSYTRAAAAAADHGTAQEVWEYKTRTLT